MPFHCTKERKIASQTRFGREVFPAAILLKRPTSSKCGSTSHVLDKDGSSLTVRWRRHAKRIGFAPFGSHRKMIGVGHFSKVSTTTMRRIIGRKLPFQR